MSPPNWESSSDKHGVSREAQAHAIVNASFVHTLEITARGDRVVVYIGPEHAFTDREVEVLVREPRARGRPVTIFHAMPLGPKFRTYREENPDGRVFRL